MTSLYNANVFAKKIHCHNRRISASSMQEIHVSGWYCLAVTYCTWTRSHCDELNVQDRLKRCPFEKCSSCFATASRCFMTQRNNRFHFPLVVRWRLGLSSAPASTQLVRHRMSCDTQTIQTWEQDWKVWNCIACAFHCPAPGGWGGGAEIFCVLFYRTPN